MEETGKLKLKKPGASDNADIAVLNGNMDKLDAAVSELNTGKADLDPVTRKVKPEQLPEMDFDPSGSAAAALTAARADATAKAEAVNTKLTQHGGDASAHVTAAKQAAWDAKETAGSGAAAVRTHDADAAAHGGLFAGVKTWAQGVFAALTHRHTAADITSGILPVARGGTGGGTAQAARDSLGAVAGYRFTATIPTTGWAAATKGVKLTLYVSGVTADMTPTVDVVQSSDIAAAALQLEGFACVSRMVTGGGNVTVYCYDGAPKVAVPVQLVGVT